MGICSLYAFKCRPNWQAQRAKAAFSVGDQRPWPALALVRVVGAMVLCVRGIDYGQEWWVQSGYGGGVRGEGDQNLLDQLLNFLG